jgi:hypothetical protein
MNNLNIDIMWEVEEEKNIEELIHTVVQKALGMQNVTADVELSIVITDNNNIRQINKEFRERGRLEAAGKEADICSCSQHSIQPTSKCPPSPLDVDALMFTEQLCLPPSQHVNTGIQQSVERAMWRTSFRHTL